MRRPPIPWIILLVSLFLTAFAAWQADRTLAVRSEERLASAVESTTNQIRARINTYIAMLRGGVGLFAADEEVTLEDFHRYTNHLDLPTRYPGIQGIGFTIQFQVEDQDSLVDMMREQGVPDFRVWPEVDAPERHAIIFLEPQDERNRAARGYDMYSEAVRQKAMSRARDTGEPSISGRVTLVQEIEGRQQAGFLIYVPVYEGGVDPGDIESRRALLRGFVYAPFRADDLFTQIFEVGENVRVAYRIYDGVGVDPDKLLHDSRTNSIDPMPGATYDTTVRLAIAGNDWTIAFAPTSYFETGITRRTPLIILIAGGILSVLLAALSATQVQAEQLARRNERMLRAVLEALPVGVSVAERNGRIRFSNSASRRIWGTSAESEVVRSGEADRYNVETNRLMAPEEWAVNRARDGVSIEGEIIRVVRPDGISRVLLNSAAPIFGSKGQIELVVASEVDITREKQAEAALREREQEFRSMIDSIPQLAWMADARGEVLWYNNRWLEYTGATLQQLKERGWQAFVHPDALGRVVDRIQRSFAIGEAWEDTFRLQGAGESYRYFLYRAVPILDDAGEIFRWFGTGTDVTEQIQAREAEARAIREQVAREAAEQREEQLRKHAAELERSNRELQDFAYVASHDLQEPLRKISTFTDLVLEEYGTTLEADGRLYLERVRAGAVRMSRLIKDLLAFSRVATRGQPFEEVELNDVLDDVLNDLEILLEDTGGEVRMDPLPTVEADPVQMRQLFQNLIGNALKFHAPDVKPVVTVRGTVEHDDEDEQQICRIEVCDNGVGFEEKYLDRIFSPFQRLHNRSEYEGTGIGLAICRRIVERHSGTITASSEPGRGSTFIVELPVRTPEGSLA